MREGLLCLVMFTWVSMEDFLADRLSFWMAYLAQVSTAKTYAGAINAFQLVGVEESGCQGCFHERSIVFP